MRRFVLMLSCILLVFMLSPVNGFALQYRYEDWDYEFDDTNYWINGWCYRPFDESEKTAILVAYDPNIIKGDVLVIPESINGYKINGFSHGLFQRSTFKSCDLSSFPNLAKRMFEESSLEHVVLSKDTKNIPNGCFLDCPLKEIELHEGIETIDDYAFRGTKLKELVIPSTVKALGYQVVNNCPELKKLELKNGALTGFNEESLCLGVTFMTENLETLILPENITHIGENEFKAAVPGRHSFIFIKYPDNLTVYGKKGSYAETYAAEHELSFMAVENKNSMFDEEKVNFESKYDISEFMDSSIYKIHDVFDTDYGAVVYYSMGGFMRAPGPGLSLVRENGDIVNLSLCVSMKDPYRRPEHNDITLSEDGKYVTFNVSFDERAEGPEGMLGGSIVVFHDAGTYYYKADLEEGICIETKFEPLDTISEEVISAWAKPEVENAIETGFVPLSFRDNYKRNITRGEFAKLAMFFLSVQYGYPGVPIVKLWSPAEPNDNEYFSREFMNAYCSSRTDRNGSFFTDNNTGEKYSYNNTGEILLPRTPFLDVNENKDLRFIERAYYLGIVNGIGETDFNPDGEITRQEAAAMLMRVYKNYAKTEETAAGFKFNDDSDIADWAKEDVYNINVLGVMQGVGENVFAPLDGYTVEQSIATFWRLYDKAPVSRKNKNIEPLLDYEFELENYFKRDDGTCFQEKSRTEFKNFVIVCGFWQQENTNDSDCKLFVFDKNGGVPFISPLTKEMKWEVSSDENVITCYENVEDTFRLYNKLNGTEKVYSAGMYKTDYSVEQGKILNFERIN